MSSNMSQVGAFVFLFVILYHGYLLGQRLFPRLSWISSLIPGLILFVAIQSVIQTGWYYLGHPLGFASDLVSLIGTSFVAQLTRLIKREIPAEIENQEPVPIGISRRMIAVLNVFVASASAGAIMRYAWSARTLESIRTPWPLLPEQTLYYIALVWLTFVFSIILLRSRWLTALHGMLAIGSAVSIAPIIYRLGFGFDGFLHIASEKIILATGTLNPKPLYYIGQYAFTTWLSRLASISIADVDRWLLPVFSALFLPFCLMVALPPRRDKIFGFLALGLIPLSGFIATTPQGFAYVLGLCALLLGSASAEKNAHPVAPIILSAWAIAVHPLAGLPLFFILLAYLFRVSRFKQLSWIFIILAGVSIPSLFYFLSLRSGTPIIWNLNSILDAQPWLDRLQTFWPALGNHFVLWPAWASLVARSLPLFLSILSIIGLFSRQEEEPIGRGVWILSALSLWIAAVVLKTAGEFSFLIDYERGNYADRLNFLALLALIPSSIHGFNALAMRFRQAPKIFSLIVIIFFTMASTALVYDSLPRHDALVTGRGWSVGANDAEAVKIIDRDAQGNDYTVLANQSVSAIAVSILGFKRYAGEVFFYPIPTGGPLYEQYLRMTYNEPSRDTAKDAGRLGKTNLVYVVINDYWWRAETVSEAIAGIADGHWSIGEGKVYIYKFDLSKASSSPTATSTR